MNKNSDKTIGKPISPEEMATTKGGLGNPQGTNMLIGAVAGGAVGAAVGAVTTGGAASGNLAGIGSALGFFYGYFFPRKKKKSKSAEL